MGKTLDLDYESHDSNDEEVGAQAWVCDRCWESISDPDAAQCQCGNPRPRPGWVTMPHVFRERYKLVRRLRSVASGVVFLATEEIPGADDGDATDDGPGLMILAVNRSPNQASGRRRMLLNHIETASHLRKLPVDARPPFVDVLASSKASPGFLALEQVAWPTLGEALEQETDGKLRLDKAIKVLVATASALERLHSCGRASGSLTPRSLLIDRAGQHVRVMLLGFEHACALDSSTDFAPVDADAVAAIDAPYVPPEVRDGQRPSASSDVFSMAALLWRMLSGHAPPLVDAGSGKSMGRLLPGSPGAKGVPEEITAALSVALSVDRAARPKTPTLVLEEIRRLLPEMTPPAAVAPTSPSRTVVIADVPPTAPEPPEADAFATRIDAVVRSLAEWKDSGVRSGSTAMSASGQEALTRLEAAAKEMTRHAPRPPVSEGATARGASAAVSPAARDADAVQKQARSENLTRGVDSALADPDITVTEAKENDRRPSDGSSGPPAMPVEWRSARILGATACALVAAFLALAPRMETREAIASEAPPLGVPDNPGGAVNNKGAATGSSPREPASASAPGTMSGPVAAPATSSSGPAPTSLPASPSSSAPAAAASAGVQATAAPGVTSAATSATSVRPTVTPAQPEPARVRPKPPGDDIY